MKEVTRQQINSITLNEELYRIKPSRGYPAFEGFIACNCLGCKVKCSLDASNFSLQQAQISEIHPATKGIPEGDSIFFVSSRHVETVVSLSHKNADTHINVNIEFGEGDGKIPVDKIAQKAGDYRLGERITYKVIQDYIESKYGFKVHTAYIAEVKRDLGLPMYDAPNAVEEPK